MSLFQNFRSDFRQGGLLRAVGGILPSRRSQASRGGLDYSSQTPGRVDFSGQKAHTPATIHGRQYSQPIGPQPQRRVTTPQPTFSQGPRVQGPVNTGATTQRVADTVDQPTQQVEPEGPDPRSLELAEIENMYNRGMGYLGGLRQSYQGRFPDVQNTIRQGFDPLRNTLNTSRDQLMSGVDLQRQEEGQRRLNAMAEARALANELQTGNRQRFGGSSSAGEFTQAFHGRELARGMGNIASTSDQNMRALDQQRQNVEQNYQTELQNLEIGVQQALDQAQQELQAKLDWIEAQEMQLGQDRSAERLEALRDFNARRESIEDQKRAFEQQLGANALAMQQNMATSINELRAQQGQPVNLADLPGAQFTTFQGQQQSPGQRFLTNFQNPEELQFQFNPLFAREEEQAA